MFIRQSEEEIKQSLVLNVNCAIQRIRVAEAALWSTPPNDLALDVDSELEFRPSGVRRQKDSIVFVVDFLVTARGPGDESVKSKDLFRVSCKLEAEYTLRPEFDPTEVQITAFHKGNVIFNCWPYFREFVQNTTLRMHIPPPPIPFLRLAPPQKESRVSDGEQPVATKSPGPKGHRKMQLKRKPTA